MTKTCPSCGYTGELTWRNGDYHCAMCDTVIAEDAPEIQEHQEYQEEFASYDAYAGDLMGELDRV